MTARLSLKRTAASEYYTPIPFIFPVVGIYLSSKPGLDSNQRRGPGYPALKAARLELA